MRDRGEEKDRERSLFALKNPGPQDLTGPDLSWAGIQ